MKLKMLLHAPAQSMRHTSAEICWKCSAAKTNNNRWHKHLLSVPRPQHKSHTHTETWSLPKRRDTMPTRHRTEIHVNKTVLKNNKHYSNVRIQTTSWYRWSYFNSPHMLKISAYSLKPTRRNQFCWFGSGPVMDAGLIWCCAKLFRYRGAHGTELIHLDPGGQYSSAIIAGATWNESRRMAGVARSPPNQPISCDNNLCLLDFLCQQRELNLHTPTVLGPVGRKKKSPPSLAYTNRELDRTVAWCSMAWCSSSDRKQNLGFLLILGKQSAKKHAPKLSLITSCKYWMIPRITDY